MPFYTTQFTVETVDNNAANFATNTWHCEAADTTGLVNFNIAVANFYAAVDENFGVLTKTTNGLRWKSYNKADLKPRAPVVTGVANLTPSTGLGLPTEVALCVSFQSLPTSGIRQSRRRGRIYLPFLLASLNGTDSRPTTAFVNVVVAAADALVTTSKAATDYFWGVHSPTTGATTEVDNGWVDNEWDTQRRRGRPRTTRTIFS